MKKKIPHKTHAFFALCITLGLVLVVSSTATMLVLIQKNSYPQEASVLSSLPTLSNVSLEAKAAIVFDPSDGRILYQKNASEQLPLASLTKLMTAEVLLTAESPDTAVTISSHAVSVKADQADANFKAGDTLALHDLLRVGLIASSNVAMQAAAESLGADYITRMNEVAGNLGLSNTHFNNPTGLDINSTTSGAYSSVYDVARLASLFYKQYPSYFELTQNASVSVGEKGIIAAQATSLPLLSIPGFIGAKTGYTDLAGGNLVALFDVEIGHPLVAVVLGSSEQGRFDDIKTLISAARAH